jgi:hypothetical protein
MPGSIIGELLLRPVLEIIFHVVAYYIGRGVVTIVTLGGVSCDRITSDTPRSKLRWRGLFHRRGGRVHLNAEATAVIGLIAVALTIGCVILIRHWAT